MFSNWLKTRGGGQTINSSAENEKNVTSRKLKKKKVGTILIEVAFTLPIVVYLVFFCIELIKINITQEALQSICEEITYLTIAHDYEDGADLIKKGDAIIEKYRPSFIPKNAKGYTDAEWPVIRWVYETYSDFSNMLNTSPYGGSTIVYPLYETDANARLHGSQAYSLGNKARFIPAAGMECPARPENYKVTAECLNGAGFPANKIFVLTVTCKYPFSSGIVKMLFGGGSNTKIITIQGGHAPKNIDNSYKNGDMYLLWARGAGIVNPK